jgi:hypothetical protein
VIGKVDLSRPVGAAVFLLESRVFNQVLCKHYNRNEQQKCGNAADHGNGI